MATQLQTEQLNMFQTVEDQMMVNLDVMSAIPGFKNRYDEFVANLKYLYQLNEVRTTKNSGASEILKQLREKLIDSAYSIASKLTAYALQSGKQALQSEIDYSKTDLKGSSYQNLVSQGEIILNRARTYLPELSDYKITQAMVDDFRDLLSQCRDSIPAVRENINKKATSGKNMTQLIRANQLLLDEIDKLIEVIRESDTAIYDDYKKARKVIGLPTRRKAIMGKITNAGGGEPLEGVSIVFYMNDDMAKSALAANNITTNGKPVLTKKSAKQGGFKVDSLPAGLYRVELIKNGYQTQVFTIAINASETARIEVEMKKD